MRAHVKFSVEGIDLAVAFDCTDDEAYDLHRIIVSRASKLVNIKTVRKVEHKMELPVVNVSGRFLLDWGDETDSQQACVHGIKLRWICEECAEELAKAQPASDPQNKDILWDANPDCDHNIVDSPGGGVKCTKCGGWKCF